MKKTKLSIESARRIALNAQLLDGRKKFLSDKKGIAQIIDRLGYVQIDTISVVRRSHLHTLWVRMHDFQEDMLHALQAKDRLIFEYWTHAMSYVPMSDYRFFLPRMKNFENPKHKWFSVRFKECEHLFKQILERIKNEGPLSSKDFSHSPNKKAGTWWDWKPAKTALELLFWKGDLMISERRNFQKVYDLTERVLPSEVDTTMPKEEESGDYLVKRALAALGIAREKDIQRFMQPESLRDADYQLADKKIVAAALNKLIEEKIVTPVFLEGDDNSKHYVLSSLVSDLELTVKNSNDIFFLSPFDNLIIQRDRVHKLFGFDYTLECYLPSSKRNYGYFVLPILWKNNFIGRIDPKADRKTRKLIINNLHFEPKFNSFDEFLPLFANELINFARFNKCDRVSVKNVSNRKVKEKLTSLLRNSIN